MKKNNIIFILLIFLILLLALLICFQSINKRKSDIILRQSIKNQIMNDFQKRIEEKASKGLIFFKQPFIPISNNSEGVAYGTIEDVSISEHSIKLKENNYYSGGNFFEYLKEPDCYILKIAVDNDTKIVKREMDFSKSQNDLAPSPFLFKDSEISFESLKPGMEVIVEAVAKFDLPQSKEIKAKKIIVLSPIEAAK